MQKFLRYLFLTVATAVFVSCEDSVVVPETVFEISEDRIDAAYSGGTYKVGYTLTNPVEGERVEAFSEQEWIGSFDASADGEIFFEVSENLTGSPREGELTVYYTGLDDEWKINVYQEGAGSLTVRPSVLDVPCSGGTCEITCTSSVPDGEILIDVSSEQGWLNGFESRPDGVVHFNVDRNVASEPRKGIVDIVDRITGDSVHVTVNQAGSEAPFTFSVDDVATTTVSYSVYPEDPELTYVANVIEKEVFEKYASDEEFFQNELEYFRLMADIYQVSLGDYLAGNVLRTGDYVEGHVEVLSPETAHYIYAYGLDVSATRLTDIFKEEFVTEAKPRVDMTFEFMYDIIDGQAHVSVFPSTQDYFYYFSVMRTEGLEPDTDMEDIMQDYLDYVIEYYMIYNGGTVEDAMRAVCFQGIGLNSFDLISEKEYVLFAAGVDIMTGMVISDVATETFDSGIIGPSDNVITLELVSEGFTTADIRINTTNEDPYVFFIDVASNTEGMTDEEIIAYYNQKDLTYFQRSGDFLAEITERQPGTDYRAFAFGYSNYVPTTGLASVTFRAHEMEECDIEMDVVFDKYFSIDELKENYPGEFSDIPSAYEVLMPVSVVLSGSNTDGAQYRYNLYEGNHTNVINYYDMAEDILAEGCPYPSTRFYFTEGCYGTPYTIIGVVADKDGNYGKLFTKLVVLTEEGLSPAEEYVFPEE